MKPVRITLLILATIVVVPQSEVLLGQEPTDVENENEEEKVIVRGTVTDGATGIDKVKVRAINTDAEELLGTDETGADGTYKIEFDKQPEGEVVRIEFSSGDYGFGEDSSLKGQLQGGRVHEINKVLRAQGAVASSSVFEGYNAPRLKTAQVPSVSSARVDAMGAGVGAMAAGGDAMAAAAPRPATVCYETTSRRLLRPARKCCVCVPARCSGAAACGVATSGSTRNVFIDEATGEEFSFSEEEAKQELRLVFDNLQFIENFEVNEKLAGKASDVEVRDRILAYLENVKGLPGIQPDAPTYEIVFNKLNQLRGFYDLDGREPEPSPEVVSAAPRCAPSTCAPSRRFRLFWRNR